MSPSTKVTDFTYSFSLSSNIRISIDEPDMQDTAGEAGTNS